MEKPAPPDDDFPTKTVVLAIVMVVVLMLALGFLAPKEWAPGYDANGIAERQDAL